MSKKFSFGDKVMWKGKKYSFRFQRLNEENASLVHKDDLYGSNFIIAPLSELKQGWGGE